MRLTDNSETTDRILTSAPHRIGVVTLVVRDLDRIVGFYREVIGLSVLTSSGSEVLLGTEARPLIRLHSDRSARIGSSGEAGLFHTAFLLPSRAHLGAWLMHGVGKGISPTGASDHGVSEAVYLVDPEGNGIEIYADRPATTWNRGPKGILMRTGALDLQALVQTARNVSWTGFPVEGTIGHVHLQVGDLMRAEEFYVDHLGFEPTCRYPGAVFFGSGGYHHQLAANIWNSAGADERKPPLAGLAEVEIETAPDTLAAIRSRAGASTIGDLTSTDPWGISIRLVPTAPPVP
jgi:catechol 2,3-dioxygenase